MTTTNEAREGAHFARTFQAKRVAELLAQVQRLEMLLPGGRGLKCATVEAFAFAVRELNQAAGTNVAIKLSERGLTFAEVDAEAVLALA